MKAESVEIAEKQLRCLLDNAEKKKTIVKMMIQALYSMGLEGSAEKLEQESAVSYLTPELKSLRQHLAENNYQQVHEHLQNHKPNSTEPLNLLQELQIMQAIKSSKLEEALQLLKQSDLPEQRKKQLTMQLMMGNGSIDEAEVKRKHEIIIEKSFNKEIEENSLAKILMEYSELEKRGLVKFLPGISMKEEQQERLALPKNLVRKSEVWGEVSILRFNRKGNKFIMINEEGKKKSVGVLKINPQTGTFEEVCSYMIEEEQQIQDLSWNYGVGAEQSFAFCTYYRVMVFSVEEGLISDRHIKSENKSQKILCLDWNPINKLLYIGGNFDSLKVVNHRLQDRLIIHPFMNSRNIRFHPEGRLILAISVSVGVLTMFNVFTEEQISRYCTPEPIMSIKVESQNKVILVTQKTIRILTIQNKEFQCSATLENPESSGSVIPECGLFGEWILCLDKNKFRALGVREAVEDEWSHGHSSTFDVSGEWMISGGATLSLWTNTNFQEQEPMDEEMEILSQAYSEPPESEEQEEEEEEQDDLDDDD